MGGGGGAWAEVAVRACGPIYSVFLFFAWVGHIGLRLCDLIVHRRRPVGGAPPCRMANAGRYDYKKKKKKKTTILLCFDYLLGWGLTL